MDSVRLVVHTSTIRSCPSASVLETVKDWATMIRAEFPDAVDISDTKRMTNLLVTWLLSALSLLIVAYLIKGFDISGFGSALLAAVVIGLANGTIGFFLKVVTFPLTILTLGLFWWVINALMLKLAAAVVPGFKINGFLPALIGALVLSLVNLLLRTFLQV